MFAVLSLFAKVFRCAILKMFNLRLFGHEQYALSSTLVREVHLDIVYETLARTVVYEY